MLCACFSRACGRGGVWFARFLVGFSAVFGGGFACLFGGCFWVGFGGVWVGVVGERERQRRTGKGERAQGRTATANGASVNGRTACPFWVGFRPSTNLIFLALIIFAVWWGVFYSQTATEKRRTVCVRSLSLPRTFLRTPNTSVR